MHEPCQTARTEGRKEKVPRRGVVNWLGVRVVNTGQLSSGNVVSVVQLSLVISHSAGWSSVKFSSEQLS